MKRYLFGIIATLCVLVSPTVGAVSVQDFVINSFDAEYHLSRDSNGRSILATTERITATFPEFDQNHGIERALPQKYDSHATHLTIDSVVDAQGRRYNYETYDSNDNMIVRIGDADSYAHGQKVYIISYTQHDVTKFFANLNDDELYWDTNGTQWSQPVESLTARVTVDASLIGSLTGNYACYQGGEGATERCDMVQEGHNFTASSSRVLNAGENVTFAVGFKAGTFAAYQPTAEERFMEALFIIWGIVLLVSSIGAVAVITWIGIFWHRTMRRVKGRGTIIPEYLPPGDASVLASAQVMKLPVRALTAQILDLAVRHYIKIYQTKEKKLLQSAEYDLELIKDPAGLAWEEKQLLADMFGKNAAIGSRFAMKKLRANYSMGQQLAKHTKVLRDHMRGSYAYFEKAMVEAKRLKIVATVCLVVGIVGLSPLMIIAAIIGYSCAYTLWPLTKKGVTLRDYLSGLKVYIEVAETERIAMLQSPEGAEKVGKVGKNSGALVKLYERVLPYAVVFGIEKEWIKQMGVYYDEASTQPDWYSGMNGAAFNAVLFSSSLSSFTEQVSTYSASTSSSSGGSGGGGFSGGGGGGGGGGGW
jgi:uncharacterized membrane protein YgcG